VLVDLVGSVGHRVRRASAAAVGSLRALGALIRAGVSMPHSVRRESMGALARQIRYTAWDSLPIVCGVAVLCGVIIIAEVNAQATRFGLADSVARVVAVAGVRDVGPALTALIVAGCSGTAIAAELATARALGETDALDALGVDLLQYYVLPRVAGLAIATAALTLIFDAVTLGAGLVTAQVMEQMAASDYLTAVHNALRVADVWEAIARGMVAGTAIAALSSLAGLVAHPTPSAIPRSARRAMIWSTVAVFAVATVGSYLRLIL
jgi:phospholipid/cholesterol/gamma-HCH transport system permease protein